MRNVSLATVVLLCSVAGAAHAEHNDASQTATATPRIDKAVRAASITGEKRLTGPVAAAGAVGANSVGADPGRPVRGQRLEPFLAASEITAGVSTRAADIERCYLGELGEVRQAGRLDVTLVIGRDGSVVSVHTAATGLAAKSTPRVASCIEAALVTARFPERRNDTTAVVPYVFQKTQSPGSGPQLSCWNARGC